MIRIPGRCKGLAVCLALILLLCCAGAALADAAPEGYPEVRPGVDFGGKDLYIYTFWDPGDYWGEYDAKSEHTDYEEATHAWREWIQETYHVRIREAARGNWNDGHLEMIRFAYEGGEEDKYALFYIQSGRIRDVAFAGAAAPIGYDLSDVKWNRGDTAMATFGGKVYGTHAGTSEPRQCLFFNKRVLTEAGVDWNALYDAQANGTWTWKMLEDVLSQVKDSDKTEAAGIIGSTDDLYKIAVLSAGGAFITTDENGAFIPAVDSEETKAALSWARDLWYNYSAERPADAFWNWADTLWGEGGAAFFVAQSYTGFSQGGTGFDQYGLRDEWGCLAFPTPEENGTYVTPVTDTVIMVPSCYDEETVNNMMLIYDLWTSETPGYPLRNSWEDSLSGMKDRRAVQETYAMLADPEHQVADLSGLFGDVNGLLGPALFWSMSADADIPALTAGAAERMAFDCQSFGSVPEPGAFAAVFQDGWNPGEDYRILIRPVEGAAYRVTVERDGTLCFEDGAARPIEYILPPDAFPESGSYVVTCSAEADGITGSASALFYTDIPQ